MQWMSRPTDRLDAINFATAGMLPREPAALNSLVSEWAERPFLVWKLLARCEFLFIAFHQPDDPDAGFVKQDNRRAERE